jgi:hypothetical protein
MKRALVIVPAALLGAVFILHYLPIGRPVDLVFGYYVQTVCAAALIVGSVLLLRRTRSVPAALCLIGSIGYFIFWSLHALGERIWDSEVRTLDGCIYVHWSLCTLENWAALATLCFPIGFVWSALLPRNAPNHAMERTVDRNAPDS